MDTDTEKAPGRKRRLLPALCLLILAGALGCFAAAVHLRRKAWCVDLNVTTDPRGCGLHLDGRYVGISPVVIRGVGQGSHFVRAQREGYASRTVRVEVTRGPRQTASVDLQRLPVSRLEVVSDPPGATVILDHGERGTTPLVMEDITPGEHHLLLRRARREPWSRSVKLEPGRRTTVRAEMEDSFLKFLDAAVASEPRNMSHRAERFHYMMTVKDFDGAGSAFFEALRLMACEGVADASKGGLWHWLMRDSGLMRLDREERFAAAFSRGLAALAAEDGNAAAKVLAHLAARSRGRQFRTRNPRVFRDVYFRAAVAAAVSRPVVDTALSYAAELREAPRVNELLRAAEKANPGDAENVGVLAIRVVNLIKAGGIGGSFRGEALGAAAASVHRALDAEPADASLRARLRRVIAKIHMLQDQPEEALREQEKAITELAACGAKHADRLEHWKLEKALLLVELRRREPATALLKQLSAGAKDASIRKAASEALADLEAARDD
jgi:hypothetical protein